MARKVASPHATVYRPPVAHLSILEHVAEPQGVGINAHRVGDHVRVGLHREHHLGAVPARDKTQGTLFVYTM